MLIGPQAGVPGRTPHEKSTEGTGFGMIRVDARSGEPLEKTLRRFKKQCEKEGLTKDIKKTSYYEKPSERRRRRIRNSIRKILKEKIKSA